MATRALLLAQRILVGLTTQKLYILQIPSFRATYPLELPTAQQKSQ